MTDGWVCPKCGKVYSPSITECADCNGNNIPIRLNPIHLYPPLDKYPCTIEKQKYIDIVWTRC